MKKYIKPALEINEVVVENMLALSANEKTSTDNKMYAPRRRSSWEADWD